MFSALNLPPASLNLTKKGDQVLVYCIVRRKKLVLTPEEWVRQHVVHYLVQHKHIPISRIGSEILLKVGNASRRVDLIVYDDYLQPFLLIECKATHVHLDSKVVQQIIHYNSVLQVPKIAITNGLSHEIIGINYETAQFEKLQDFV